MALLWIDGFDHYTNASGAKFNTVQNGAYNHVNTNAEIFTMPELGGLGFWTDVQNVSTPSLRKNFATSYSSGRVGLGFHYYLASGHSVGGSPFYIAGFCDASGNPIIGLGEPSSGNLFHVYAGSSETSLANSGSNSWSEETLYHIEMVIDIENQGSFEVRVNGETWISYAADLSSTAVGGIFLNKDVSGGGWRAAFYDNLYAWDDTGSYNNDWLGERNIYTLMPDGDGPDQDWVPSSGSDGYAMIDGIPANGTDYIESTSAGDVSNFSVSDLPSTNIAILGVQTSILATKTGTDPATVSFGPQGDPSDAVAMTQDQYLYFHSISETNPISGLPWVPGEVNSLVVEIERVE